MRKLYGESLRKDAGFVKVIKNVASKNAKMLESRADKHVPELKRVVTEVKGTFDKVFEETAEAVEEFLAKCEAVDESSFPLTLTPVFPIPSQPAPDSQRSCKTRKCCCSNLASVSSSRK